MNIRTKDGLTDAIEGLRQELGAIKEELRVIDMRKPALESRAERIGEAIQTLVGDGSTGDPRWMSLPRVIETGLERSTPSFAAASAEPRAIVHREKRQIGPVRKPEITEDAILAMADYTEHSRRPVKSAELYEYLVKEGIMEPIETEMPYKSFAITLRNVQQEFIEYDRASKTWNLKDRSPRAKLKEALEKGDGTRVLSSNNLGLARSEHPFVKAVIAVFKEHRWEPLAANRLYDELSEKRESGLIPGVGNFVEFVTTLTNYGDFFPVDEATQTYRATKPEAAPRETVTSNKIEVAAGVPGLYTVKSNGGVTA
ncbi:MAG TPA: hypothetical protein VFD13_05730 [Candidatus Kapabacteria bacterium]|nr:hypothetical protein [Candidatus Kapabacteria bacterium]